MGHSEVVDGLIKDGERGKGKRAGGVVDGLGSSIKENWTRGGGGERRECKQGSSRGMGEQREVHACID